MKYKKTNKQCERNHRLWVKRNRPMHNETWEEIRIKNEEICKDCQYCERIEGEMICCATDKQWKTDDVPCKEEKNGNNK